MNMHENIYWLFSSSAQAIAAFCALIVAGYALVNTMMDAMQEKDETLEEIHSQIKNDYYKAIIWFSCINGLAIVLSLLTVYLNGVKFKYLNIMSIFTALFVLSAIAGGIWFVLSIINPNRYKNTAKHIIGQKSISGIEVDVAEFINLFIKMEKVIREIFIKKKLKYPITDKPSFGHMIKVMEIEELLTKKEYGILENVNNYRNLVIHGHIDKVDKGMVDILRNILNVFQRKQEEL
ncbi:MAG: hypothetical protein JW803_01545 [Endomicrobiales bacterium]|nr:hypothetical protein [Endomicrobiales bacterium]